MSIFNSWRAVAVLFVALCLTGCERSLQKVIEDTLPEQTKAYEGARRLPPLEIPPDLTKGRVGDRLNVPGSGQITLKEMEQGAVATTTSTAVLPQQTDIRVKRDGDKRWLVVDARPDQV